MADPVFMSDTTGTSDIDPTTEQAAVADSATEAPAEKGSLGRGRLAAIGGGAAALGLVLGLLIGWFAFDDGGKGNDRHNDRGRMSQQQGPGRGHQDGGQMGGGQFGGGQMGPGGMQGGQMMPGNGGSQSGPGQGSQVTPSTPAPSTPSTQGSTVPQSLQQG